MINPGIAAAGSYPGHLVTQHRPSSDQLNLQSRGDGWHKPNILLVLKFDFDIDGIVIKVDDISLKASI